MTTTVHREPQPLYVVAGGREDGDQIISSLKHSLYQVGCTMTKENRIKQSSCNTTFKNKARRQNEDETLSVAGEPSIHSPQHLGRKKAYKTAVFYAECCLSSIPLADATEALSDMHGQYNKWWIDTLPSEKRSELSQKHYNSTSTKKHTERRKKRSKQSSSLASLQTIDRSFSGASEFSRKRNGVRKVIDRVSQRQNEQGGGYITPSVISDTFDCIENIPSMNQAETFGKDVPTMPNFLSQKLEVSNPSRRTTLVAKAQLLSSLSSSGGDVTDPSFLKSLDLLSSFYQSTGIDANHTFASPNFTPPLRRQSMDYSSCPPIDSSLTGTWLTLTRPNYDDSQGLNSRGHYMYKLGRMAFDMFRPPELKCSIQSQFCSVKEVLTGTGTETPLHIPRSLRKEILQCQDGETKLKTYDIIVSFVIEPNQNYDGRQVPKAAASGEKDSIIKRPIRGIMTNRGYMLPDPNTPNRFSIWFTGGSIEVNDEEADLEEWKQIFDPNIAPKRCLREQARLLAARVLLGASVSDAMDDDGSLHYELRRPIGGHGLAFCDVLFLDNDLRILRGHRGQIYVCARILDGALKMSTNVQQRSARRPPISSHFQVIA